MIIKGNSLPFKDLLILIRYADVAKAFRKRFKYSLGEVGEEMSLPTLELAVYASEMLSVCR